MHEIVNDLVDSSYGQPSVGPPTRKRFLPGVTLSDTEPPSADEGRDAIIGARLTAYRHGSALTWAWRLWTVPSGGRPSP